MVAMKPANIIISSENRAYIGSTRLGGNPEAKAPNLEDRTVGPQGQQGNKQQQ
jgi:hypothetical protein